MADPALGTKQVCPNCTAKFYDLGKHPAHCPRCDFEFDQEEVVRTRRSRARPVEPDYEDTDEDGEELAKTKAKGKTPGDEDDDDEEPEVTAPEIDEVVTDDPLLVDEDEDLDPADPARVNAPDTVDMEIEDADIGDDDDGDDVPFLEDDDDDFDEDIDLPGKDDDEDIV
ncbi:TIGR02300 family protein [Asticcacaulis sp. EMRT-3]|uniref:TIGR02300 family protein n=1 Tax=Asticcacaulis sp. EMRT-3 TaxID=3040349 RepID=UPI0024AF6377|nr:TIGR02300 family protein [Asticcacaulis sp. EMRT-3]MDI7775916.1 TIGR02300 family protein [Asticcacaulis sp. EMRT-3]